MTGVSTRWWWRRSLSGRLWWAASTATTESCILPAHPEFLPAIRKFWGVGVFGWSPLGYENEYAGNCFNSDILKHEVYEYEKDSNEKMKKVTVYQQEGTTYFDENKLFSNYRNLFHPQKYFEIFKNCIYTSWPPFIIRNLYNFQGC